MEDEMTIERIAVERVRKDYKLAKDYLIDWHRECLERYKHYRAPGLSKNILKDNQFPVPFTTEQVDQLRADMMDKLWYKNKPCSIFGRNEEDKSDADAKRKFMDYQDEEDSIFEKTDQAVFHCAIYGIAPAVVNFKVEKETRYIQAEVPIELEDGEYATDLEGNLQFQEEEFPQEITVYQGASVEMIDPIDFFWIKEKRQIYDEHPFMVRSRRTINWFESKPYIIQANISKLKSLERPIGDSQEEDLLSDRRQTTGYENDTPKGADEYNYVEWQGYANIDGTGRKLWIIGVANDKILMRLESAVESFKLGHPNIVVGTIEKEFGEVRGFSLLDKIHSLQHAQDSIMGMWIQNMRQTVNRMWIINSNKVKNKHLVNKAGNIINTTDDINKVARWVDPMNISRDVYDGLAMTRQMAQNSSGISDIMQGQAQEGVETLGEASILEAKGALRVRHYLRTFERTFIKPLWEMRNQINQNFVDDAGYLYSVIEDDIVYWRKLSPAQVRTSVDFVCEASSRENQKAVVTQQVLQALNMMTALVPVMGVTPIVMLLRKLYSEGFGWSEDDINRALPMDQIMNEFMYNKQMQAGEMAQSPGSMPQPTSEAGAITSAMTRNRPDVGVVE